MHEDLDKLGLLRREVGKIISQPDVSPEESIAELGIDSLSIVELMVFCEQLYGNFDPTALSINEFTTLSELDRQLRATAVSA